MAASASTASSPIAAAVSSGVRKNSAAAPARVNQGQGSATPCTRCHYPGFRSITTSPPAIVRARSTAAALFALLVLGRRIPESAHDARAGLHIRPFHRAARQYRIAMAVSMSPAKSRRTRCSRHAVPGGFVQLVDDLHGPRQAPPGQCPAGRLLPAGHRPCHHPASAPTVDTM